MAVFLRHLPPPPLSSSSSSSMCKELGVFMYGGESFDREISYYSIYNCPPFRTTGRVLNPVIPLWIRGGGLSPLLLCFFFTLEFFLVTTHNIHQEEICLKRRKQAVWISLPCHQFTIIHCSYCQQYSVLSNNALLFSRKVPTGGDAGQGETQVTANDTN